MNPYEHLITIHIIQTTQDIPSSITSVDMDCRHIVEKAGEGTGWVIIEAPQEHQIQVKAIHTSKGDIEIEHVLPR